MDPNREKAPPEEVCETNFESEVLKSKRPVLVAFLAPWSRPCHILDATLVEVARACAERARVVRVNADDNPELSMLYEIQSIPTLLYFIGGVMRARIVGTASKEAVLARMASAVYGDGLAAPSPEGEK